MDMQLVLLVEVKQIGLLRDEMDGAKVTVYVTNCGNGTADVQAVMVGNAGTTSTQYYLGINTIDPNDLNFALTVENAYLIFSE